MPQGKILTKDVEEKTSDYILLRIGEDVTLGNSPLYTLRLTSSNISYSNNINFHYKQFKTKIDWKSWWKPELCAGLILHYTLNRGYILATYIHVHSIFLFSFEESSTRSVWPVVFWSQQRAMTHNACITLYYVVLGRFWDFWVLTLIGLESLCVEIYFY